MNNRVSILYGCAIGYSKKCEGTCNVQDAFKQDAFKDNDLFRVR